jgi:hypothetical protein
MKTGIVGRRYVVGRHGQKQMAYARVADSLGVSHYFLDFSPAGPLSLPVRLAPDGPCFTFPLGAILLWSLRGGGRLLSRIFRTGRSLSSGGMCFVRW